MFDLLHLVIGLRLTALVLWSIITLWSAPAYLRILRRQARRNDWTEVVLAVVGLALVTYQSRILIDVTAVRTDYQALVAVLLLDVAAVIAIVFVHLPCTPPGHKRAMLFSHMGIVGACLVGGFVA